MSDMDSLIKKYNNKQYLPPTQKKLVEDYLNKSKVKDFLNLTDKKINDYNNKQKELKELKNNTCNSNEKNELNNSKISEQQKYKELLAKYKENKENKEITKNKENTENEENEENENIKKYVPKKKINTKPINNFNDSYNLEINYIDKNDQNEYLNYFYYTNKFCSNYTFTKWKKLKQYDMPEFYKHNINKSNINIYFCDLTKINFTTLFNNISYDDWISYIRFNELKQLLIYRNDHCYDSSTESYTSLSPRTPSYSDDIDDDNSDIYDIDDEYYEYNEEDQYQ
jgi:hypothetical protein